MMDEEVEVGYYERTYRLRFKAGKYAWIFDDTGEIYDGLLFDSGEEARNWHDNRFGKISNEGSIRVAVKQSNRSLNLNWSE